jgi:hypothetical protein
MKRRQTGQALVGSLVVTTLAFLMAGAVAVGTSALLSQESNNGPNASSRDLSAQDALAAAVAGVAGKGSGGGSAPCSTPSLLPATVLPSGYSSQAHCARVDGVPSGPLTLVRLSGNCAFADMSSYSSDRVLIWFSSKGNVSAWVDNQSGCKQKNPLCSNVAPTVDGSIFQLVLDCDIAAQNPVQYGTGNTTLYLHVQNSGQSPFLVRLARYTSSGGAIYVLAASTGLPGGPAYEEADVWVSPDGAQTALRFEGIL